MFTSGPGKDQKRTQQLSAMGHCQEAGKLFLITCKDLRKVHFMRISKNHALLSGSSHAYKSCLCLVQVNKRPHCPSLNGSLSRKSSASPPCPPSPQKTATTTTTYTPCSTCAFLKLSKCWSFWLFQPCFSFAQLYCSRDKAEHVCQKKCYQTNTRTHKKRIV